MREFVLQMLTTLNGRLDTPFDWVSSVPEDLYASIDEAYATFDTIVVGRTTYEEMAGYWPGALHETQSGPTNLSMARKMSEYRKVVVTREESPPPSDWQNVEFATVRDDSELLALADRLRAEQGRDVHVAGGAKLAQTLCRLGAIDRYRLYVHPVVSPGQCWHQSLVERVAYQMGPPRAFSNGAVLLEMMGGRTEAPPAAPVTFSEMLT